MKTAIQEIKQLFESKGDEAYFGENVSQFEHAAQTAMLAENANFDVEFQIAAFLHDIGHLLPANSDEELMEIYGRKNHEFVAANWLKMRGFSEKIAILILNHVNAKRYLTFANLNYYENLSDASKKTLAFQGGRMIQIEAEIFERNPYFEEIIQLRKFDEAAKIPKLETPDLEYFLNLCQNFLTKNKQKN